MQHNSHDKPVLFISDLHLDPSRPAIARLFHGFLQQAAQEAQALYILGDLFEAWIGDDAVPDDDPIIAALNAFSATGIPLRIMRGNRDFLLGSGFAEMTGAELLADPTTIEIDGEPVLLMHGDSLCIDDVEYQQFRTMVRNPEWQQAFLAKSVPERIEYAKQARTESTSRNQSIDDYLMDVNQGAVVEAFRDNDVRWIIHGHTHRPAVHDVDVDGNAAKRIVLGDWFDQGSVLRWENGTPDLQALPLAE